MPDQLPPATPLPPGTLAGLPDEWHPVGELRWIVDHLWPALGAGPELPGERDAMIRRGRILAVMIPPGFQLSPNPDDPWLRSELERWAMAAQDALCCQEPHEWSGVDLQNIVDGLGVVLAAVRIESEPDPTDPRESAEPALPALTDSDRRVLLTMSIFDPALLLSAEKIANEMVPAERLAPRTIGPVLQKLIALELAERPEGDRKGARLTLAGRRLAQKIAD